MRRSLRLATLLVSILVLAACVRQVVATPTPIPTPAPPDPQSLADAYVEALNAGDIENLLAIFADDIVLSLRPFWPLPGEASTGKNAVLASLTGGIADNWQIAITRTSVEGNALTGEFSLKTSGALLTGTVEVLIEGETIASIKHTLDQKSREKLLGPQGYALSDPSFQALEGAQAFFGELGGTIYQIEVPDNWNRRLVLWAHGFREFGPQLTVNPPPFREYLIENGYAWAASSFSSNSFVAFEGAHETAALHDFFIRQFGKPDYTYISGGSMGGRVTLLSLELFPNRYNGALALCSVVDLDYYDHYVVLGAYVTGVTQEEFDAAESSAQLIRERILPALESDPQARALFESLIATLTGGPRPFRHEGFDFDYKSRFNFLANASEIFGYGHFDNTDFVYSVDPASGVSAEEVNATVARIRGDPQLRNVAPNFNELAGAVPIPLLMLHTTGDDFVSFSGMQIFRRLADAADNGDLLVQRAIRAPGHCDFSYREMTTALEDLFNWVEDGVKAEGEDILGPLQDVGLKFTDPLRLGDPGGL